MRFWRYFVGQLAGCLAYWPLFLIPCLIGLVRNRRTTTGWHELGKLVLSFWCGWLLHMTVSLEALWSDLLCGQLQLKGNVSLIPGKDLLPILRGGDAWTVLVNLGGNLGVFIPYGFLVAALWPKLGKLHWSLLMGAGFSCLIESLQLFTDRVTSIDDVMLNTIGTLLGCALYRLLYSHQNRKTT